MALNRQNVGLNFHGGIDTKSDEKLVIPGKLVELVNRTLKKNGAVVKRDGYELVAGSADTDSLFTTKNALHGFSSSGTLRSVNAVAGEVSSLGQYNRHTTIRRHNVLQDVDNLRSVDAATDGTITVFAYSTTTGGGYIVMDAKTNAVLSSSTGIGSGYSPRLAVIDGHVVMFYTTTSSATGVTTRIFRLSDGLGSTDVVSGVGFSMPQFNGAKAWDVSDDGFIVYANNADQPVLKTIKIKLNTDGTFWTWDIGDTETMSTTMGECCAIAYSSSQSRVYVAYHANPASTNNIYVNAFTVVPNSDPIEAPSLTSYSFTDIVNTRADVRNITAIAAGSGYRVLWEMPDSDTSEHYVELSTGSSPTVFARSVGLASKLFNGPHGISVNLVHESVLQPTVFSVLADSTAPTLLAVAMASEAGGHTEESLLPLPRLAYTKEGLGTSTQAQYIFPCTSIIRVESDEGQLFYKKGAVLLTLTKDRALLRNHARLGDASFFPGGFLSHFDGKTLSGNGFPLYPETIGVATSTTGGLIEAGNYSYVAVYQRADATGAIHRSAESIAVSGTTTGSTSMNTITVPTLRIGHTSDTKIAVFRTTDGGENYFKVDEIENDPSVDTVDLIDTFDDETLLVGESLYTNGGVLEHYPCPNPSFVLSHQNRLFVVPSEDRYTVYFSKKYLKGDAISFAGQEFSITFDEAGGEIVGLASLDEKVLVLRERGIYSFYGDGPDDLGFGQFSTPKLETLDVGCANPTSICSFAGGVIFQSLKGIYLFGRDMVPTYVGADVEGYKLRRVTNSLVDNQVTSAVMLQNESQVRLSIYRVAQDPVVLVYDYEKGQWSTFEDYPVGHATVFDGLYTAASSDRTKIIRDNPGVHKDETADGVYSFISSRIKTAWLKLAGLEGFQRVSRVLALGEYKSPHTVKAKLRYDYKDYVRETKEWNPTDSIPFADTHGTDTVYQLQMHLAQQKCQALQIEIIEEEDDTPALTKLSADGSFERIVLPTDDYRNVAASGQNVYVSTSSGLYRSTDGGETWALKTTAHGLTANDVNWVAASGSTVLVAVAGGNTCISTDSGATFAGTSTTMFSAAMVAAAGSTLWVSRSGTFHYVSSNAGSSWTIVGALVPQDAWIDGSTIYVATPVGVYKGPTTVNSSWNYPFLDGDCTSVWANGANVWAVVEGVLYRSTDSGASFSTVGASAGLPSDTVRAVKGSGSNVYVATDRSLAVSEDGGSTWETWGLSEGVLSNDIETLYADGSTIYVDSSPLGESFSLADLTLEVGVKRGTAKLKPSRRI